MTCFLCGILIAAMMEQVKLSEIGWPFVSVAGILLAASVIGWMSWRSYITILTRAEFYGERSTCPGCSAYGTFNVVATGMDAEPGKVATTVAPLPAAWMRVECRKCGTGWRMPD